MSSLDQRGRGQEARPPAPSAHPCEPGLPIVNIYLTPVTPRMTQMSSTSTTRLASLPPPPRTWSRPRRRLPPERPRRPRVRARAAADLVRALWAL